MMKNKTKTLLIRLVLAIFVLCIVFGLMSCAGDQFLKGYNHAKPSTEFVETEPKTYLQTITPWLVWISIVISGIIIYWKMDGKNSITVKTRAEETTDS
tara:strand:- start:541 stop:834 length:294 start_codon:yes stop_codon:yes gene_type:complete